MIELYSKGTTDFTRHGIALAATQASVTYQDNGRFDLDLTMPYNAQIAVDYGMILRAPVPKQEIGAITLGLVEYWEIAAGQTAVPLYKTVPVTSRVGYDQWEYGKEYAVGDKVSYDKKNYSAATAIVDVLTTAPPVSLPSNWTEISGTKTTGGGVLVTLAAGDQIVKTGDFNTRYMKAADLSGHEGFIEISKCTDLSETEARVVPAQTITDQSFTITEIEKSSNGKALTVHAEHISYQLGRVMLGDCNISRANPATALLFIRGAMKEDYPGAVETNLTEEDALITGDFSWKNAQSAILDPKAGLLQATTGRLIRNDLNVYIIKDTDQTARYRITYGTNLRAVKWDGNVDSLVTRVYPTAQNEDGSTLLLPEEYIDTVRTVPYIRPEALNTGLKVGQKEKQEDGSEIKLDEDTVILRMREAAQNRFTIDECDKAVITLEIDWTHLPDTEEFSQFAALRNVAPGEWVLVKNGPLGIDQTIQMTGYVFDAIAKRYTKGTFGKKKVTSSVASYDIQSGAVTSRVLGVGAVSGQNLQAGSITAREIEANSITSDRIASKSLTSDLIQANAITADEIAAGSITTVKLAAQAITADKIAAGAVTASAIGAEVIQANHIAANAITTQKIAANAVTADQIAALSITTGKLAAGAVTAEKIGAGEITADNINATNISAWSAKLLTATIDSGYINNADINYARVKDAAIGRAIIDTSITEEGIANKLYINRLMITYGQMVSATIGDLVIGASDGNYYHIDVAWDEYGEPYMVPTQVQTPSAAEIDAGRTAGGQTIIGNVGTFADLSSENFYAINSIIDRITAKRIDVDELWARQAFIDKLMVQDISSNTYIQSTVGDWQSQSTITQTVNGINSRITQLGYGTFFYSATEPDPSGVVAGDVWVQPIDDQTWNDVAQYTWDELASFTWEQVAGQYRMYVWTGTQWKLLFDNLVINELQTEIAQTAYAVTLKADMSTVNTLSGEVSQFGAQLEVQATAITAAVSSVNSKTAGYIRLTDPADDPDITLSAGDTWTKAAGFGLWQDLADYTWNELADLTWNELAGASVYTWSGSAWIQTNDYGEVVQSRTLLEQTDKQITLLAEEQETIGSQVTRNTSQITIQNDRITQEVARATNAENGKISKTTQYQTADAIVSEAVSQANSTAAGQYVTKTTTLQTADSIVTEAVRQANAAAGQNYIAKTQTYQTADSIKNEAVRVSGVNANNTYLAKSGDYQTVNDIIGQAEALADDAADTAKRASIAKTDTYQSAQAIVNTAVASAATAAGNTYIAKTTSYQTADAIVQQAESYTDDHAYSKVSGITITSSGIDISGSQYVCIASGGYFRVTSGDFGIKSDAESTDYVIWSGASTAANSSFKVKKNGEVTLTKLLVLNEQGTETEVNLRTANLWKLNYATVKSASVSGGYCSSLTFSNAAGGYTTVNFKSAASVVVSATVSDATYLSAANSNVTVKTYKDSVEYSSETHIINTSDAYNHGVAAGKTAVDFYSESLWSSGSKTITLTNSKTKTVTIPDAQDWAATYTSNGKMSVSATVGGKAINSGEITDPGYSRGETAGRSTGWSQAAAACGNSMSGINLTVTVPASTYNTTRQDHYTVAGLSTYARAGQTAYYYDQGTLKSFTIPSNTYVGNPYITTG